MGDTDIIRPKQFQSRDTVSIARSLIGKRLVAVPEGGTEQQFVVTETEAYDGPDDLACHASKGRTSRTVVMFGPPGHWYVYLIYGIHEMLNLVTGPVDYPAAVLIRGLAGVPGPGRLTKRLGINRRFNGKPATPETGLYLMNGDKTIAPERIEATPRVGIDYAGPDWSQRPYRFVLRDQRGTGKR